MPRTGQPVAQGADHQAPRGLGITETDLGLGGMDVHIDKLRVAGQIQHRRRMAPRCQHIHVSRPQGARQQLVPHGPAVHIQMLRHCRAA